MGKIVWRFTKFANISHLPQVTENHTPQLMDAIWACLSYDELWGNSINKEKQMGHKGVSKRKPKKIGPVSSANTSVIPESAQRTVKSVVKENGSPFGRDGLKPADGSNKTQKKHWTEKTYRKDLNWN
jgi:hypothetical protein